MSKRSELIENLIDDIIMEVDYDTWKELYSGKDETTDYNRSIIRDKILDFLVDYDFTEN